METKLVKTELKLVNSTKTFNQKIKIFFKNLFSKKMKPVVSFKPSKPFVINITNKTEVDIDSVSFFGAIQNIYALNPEGNFENDQIKIESGMQDVSYKDILYSVLINPQVIGITYIQSNQSAQVLEEIIYENKNIFGESIAEAIQPVIDPYQQQSGIVALKHKFVIDGFTQFKLKTLLAGKTIRFSFFPTHQFEFNINDIINNNTK